jgi:hypothetical protein
MDRPSQPTVSRRTRAFLVERGAGTVAHLGGDLLAHLVRTEALLRAWGAPGHVVHAGLAHAAYGTDGFPPRLLDLTDRPRLVALIGTATEHTVYVYASCDRAALHRRLGTRPLLHTDRFTGDTRELTTAEARDFALLSAANEWDVRDRGGLDEHTRSEIDAFIRRLVVYAPAWLTGVVDELPGS